MADMRVSGEEQKHFVTPKPDVPTYPPGLRINIMPEQLEKLGFLKAPGLKDKFTMLAKVEVVEVSGGADDRDPNDFRLELQITEMVLKGEESQQDSKASTLYGE